VTPDFKRAGDLIYILGITRDETGGSEYFSARGFVGNKVPKVVDPQLAINMYRALHRAIISRLVASCHDLSDGGLGVALAESAFSGGLGARLALADLSLEGVVADDVALFSETPCRFLVSVPKEKRSAFEQTMAGFPVALAGEVAEEPRLTVTGLDGHAAVEADIWELKKAWQEPLGI
jgi:phosphoribosylformylglycinamidine synthase